MTLIFMTVGFSDPSAPANVYRLNPVSLVRWRDNGAIARNSQHIEALLKFSVASTTYASIRLFISVRLSHLPTSLTIANCFLSCSELLPPAPHSAGLCDYDFSYLFHGDSHPESTPSALSGCLPSQIL
jgi:hypothetical protein